MIIGIVCMSIVTLGMGVFASMTYQAYGKTNTHITPDFSQIPVTPLPPPVSLQVQPLMSETGSVSGEVALTSGSGVSDATDVSISEGSGNVALPDTVIQDTKFIEITSPMDGMIVSGTGMDIL